MDTHTITGTGSEFLKIQPILTDEHQNLMNKIRQKTALLTTKHPSIVHQIIPERVREAYLYVHKMADEGTILSVKEICHIHQLLGESGKWREPSLVFFDENNIAVNGYHPADAEYIEPLMDEYTKLYNPTEKTKDPLYKTCSAYFVFEQIHPFSNGNGRVGRLLCAWLMFSYGYGHLPPYLESKWGNENKQHYQAFKSGIHHYLAWLSHPDDLNGFFNRFYLYFLNEILVIIDQRWQNIGTQYTVRL